MSALGAVVFDFDGLLADTEGVHSDTWRTALAAQGIAVTAAEYADHWIRRGRGVRDFLAGRGLPHDADVLLALKKDAYLRAIADGAVGPMPGAHAILDRLHGRTRLALVTSGRADLVGAALDALGMAGRFETSVAWESVRQPKPHPEPMLLAASRLALPPARCVALDDAEKGIVSAAEAGMPAVAVPNEHTRDHDFSRASLVAASLDELTHDVLAGLVRA